MKIDYSPVLEPHQGAIGRSPSDWITTGWPRDIYLRNIHARDTRPYQPQVKSLKGHTLTRKIPVTFFNLVNNKLVPETETKERGVELIQSAEAYRFNQRTSPETAPWREHSEVA